MFDIDPKLKDIACFIESLNSEQLEVFIDTVIFVSNGGFYDLKPIKDIELYKCKEI